MIKGKVAFDGPGSIIDNNKGKHSECNKNEKYRFKYLTLFSFNQPKFANLRHR